jgi:hypothetical protein
MAQHCALKARKSALRRKLSMVKAARDRRRRRHHHGHQRFVPRLEQIDCQIAPLALMKAQSPTRLRWVVAAAAQQLRIDLCIFVVIKTRRSDFLLAKMSSEGCKSRRVFLCIFNKDSKLILALR